MQISKKTNEITIKISENEDKSLFAECINQEDLSDYIQYLFKLNKDLNGTIDELAVYKTKEAYEKEKDGLSFREIFNAREKITYEIVDYIKCLDKVVPQKFRNSFYGPEEGIINIPTNDIIGYLNLLYERFVVLTKLLIKSHREEDQKNGHLN